MAWQALTSKLTQGTVIFCEKHSAQNPFVDPFFPFSCRQDTPSPGYGKPSFKTTLQLSRKMLLTIKPTAQKGPPQTKPQPIHPSTSKSERSRLKSKLHQEDVITQGLKAFITISQKLHPTSKQPSRPSA